MGGRVQDLGAKAGALRWFLVVEVRVGGGCINKSIEEVGVACVGHCSCYQEPDFGIRAHDRMHRALAG